MRSVSPLQLAVLCALFGSVLAVSIPAFVSNLHASRLSEPLDGLMHLAQHATMQAAGAPTEFAYPASAPRTPHQVPAGSRQKDPEGTWNHPTWKMLDFSFETPHFFSFEFESEVSAAGAHFVARAFGDLDGDGELSRFELFGETEPGGEPRTYPIRIEREVE